MTRPPGRSGSSTGITFVASIAQHVATFAPVMERIGAYGRMCRLLALDAWYGQSALEAAHEHGVTAEKVERVDRDRGARFYRRPFMAIWRDVVRARAPLGDALAGSGVVVLANDSGLLEKLAIGIARDRNARTVLIQDGRLGDVRGGRASPAELVKRVGKRMGSAMLSRAGLRFLGASAYGAGGTDLICASGASGAVVLERRSAGGSRVIVTGQPRYDRLRSRVAGPSNGPVAFFTTPFAADALDTAADRKQLALCGDVARGLAAEGIELVIKPHPREDASRYEGIPATTWITRDPADILEVVSVAIVGTSTVVEEASLLGVPVVVPGGMIHGERFAARLPDADAYPRVESVAELMDEVRALRHGGSRRDSVVALQGQLIRRELDVDPVRPAAERVAHAILALDGAAPAG